ncbi:hypothetical protein [Brevibacillus brevis]|uniref:Uncharacterized protein n=1 Tax=Brevibacillus brevis TaxID=1393 RepID=A0ABY9SXF2_BREBE|nr:hypothetical protein [Brevibacillus brevis]WNC12518.1 hypothetical protein RGB73_17465 [Brevibacillus brevis]
MSWKAVELQVAVPRSLEAGRIQEHQQQRTIHEQQSMLDERSLLDQQMRSRPVEVAQPEKSQIRERENKQQKEKQEREGKDPVSLEGASAEDKAPSSVSMRDPLRGRFIDISL